MRVEKTKHEAERRWETQVKVTDAMKVRQAVVALTFGLGGRAVGVAQRQQGHLDQLVEEHVLAHQHELGMFFLAVKVHGVLIVLHHAEHR